ncbi:hypothetical protein V6K52_19655 [Knoellia sp. S7-12]|uniref:hypothetical protein n=1 Tax=Knoellia sp. S7-12 TaxID=3126698 RepID=UPI003366A3A1
MRSAAVATVVVLLSLVINPPVGSALERVTGAFGVGDFETVGLSPQGWSVKAPQPNRAVVTSTTAISGSKSLLAEDTSAVQAVLVARPRFSVSPGSTYHLQGYAYTVKGSQSLSLQFYDAAGAVVGRQTALTTGASMVWSRLELRSPAPAAARTASIQLASSVGALSQVYWDALTLISPVVPNGGFDAVPTATEAIPGWVSNTSGGATAFSTEFGPKAGSRRLQLSDVTTTGLASVTSSRVPVFAGVTHDLRAWVYPTSGSFTLTVRWYTSAKQLIGSKSVAVSKPPSRWTDVYTKVTAPYTASYATIAVSTSQAGLAAGGWDSMQLLPSQGIPIPTYTSHAHGEPLDSFSNSTTSGTTTISGRAKIFTIVSGEPGEFQLADIETGKVERRVPLVGMNVGWGLAKSQSGLIYAGGGGGHLFEIDPSTGIARDLGKPAGGASMIWDVEVNADGRVWVATYPDAHLASYDPSTGRSTDFGSVSPEHDYARSLALNGGYAYVGLGSTKPAIVRVSLSNPSLRVKIPLPVPVTSGRVSSIGSLGRFLAVQTPGGTTAGGATYAGERRLYDTRSGSWEVPANLGTQTPSTIAPGTNSFYYLSYQQLWAVDSSTGVKTSVSPTRIPMGRDRLIYSGPLGGAEGEWLISYQADGSTGVINLATFGERTFTVKFTPTKMKIKALDEGPGGSLYVGGFGGASLSVVEADTGSRQQYPFSTTTADAIGEVEGSLAKGRYQYIGTYNAGKIFRYDTTQPWIDGTNPAPVAVLGPTHHQDRPLAWATSGSRTFFGTVPEYGEIGGVLGILDGDTGAPRIVPEPVVDQSIVSLVASKNVVFGGTSRWGGIGATPTQLSAKVFAYDAATNRKLWESTPIAGAQAFGGLTFGPGGSLWAAAGTRLVELDPSTGKVLRNIMIYPEQPRDEVTHKNADLVYAGGLLYLAAGKIYAIDPYTLRVSTPVAGGLTGRQLAVVNQRIYYASGATLRSFSWD